MSVLNKLNSITHSSNKRAGRGFGSGKGGHTAGRGMKGQNSRTGGGVAAWFEGGQLPLIKRLPMWRGKGRLKSLTPTAELTLADVESMKADTITLEALKAEKVIDRRFKKAKIIGTDAISRAVTVEGIAVSNTARKAIEKAGGSVVTPATK